MPLKKIFIFLAVICICCLSQSSLALNIQTLRPRGLSEGVITHDGSMPLGKGKYRIAMIYDFDYKKINFGNAATGQTIIKSYHIMNLTAAMGVSKRVTFELNLPIGILNEINQQLATLKDDTASLGDLELSFTVSISPAKRTGKRSVGLSLIPFMTAPSGEEDRLLGDEGMTAGVKLLVDGWFTSMNYLALSLGYRARPKETLYNLTVDDDFIWSVGYSRMLWVRHEMSAFVEVWGSTTFRKFASDEESSPIEFLIGAKKGWFDRNFVCVFGIGKGINKGYGSGEFKLVAGIAFNI